MNRLFVSTKGISTWRERLANPETQWKRKFSALETAVSWELASKSESGLPAPIERLLAANGYQEPKLLVAVAEHKVELPGGNAASQSDVWALVKGSEEIVSITIEAKAREAFGNESLERWLDGEGTDASIKNRKKRWTVIRDHLPLSDSYFQIRYQLLHRCASAVIEAKRLGLTHAAFIVQAFETPAKSFQEFKLFCDAIGIPAKRGGMAHSKVGELILSVGWADCDLATDEEIAEAAV